MEHIFKKTNGLGNPIFDISTSKGACKIVFDSNGHIAKAFCGQSPCLVYSPNDQDESCLKDVMYEMLVLSQECFTEMLSEINDKSQLDCAKSVISRRVTELAELSIQSITNAVTLNSLL